MYLLELSLQKPQALSPLTESSIPARSKRTYLITPFVPPLMIFSMDIMVPSSPTDRQALANHIQ